MSITIHKEPSTLYPAYNDSYLEFSSNLSGQTHAEITLYPSETFTNNFKIYADADGKYLFNLKEAVKARFSVDGFDDKYSTYPIDWIESYTGITLSQNMDINIYDAGTGETQNNTYTFYKSVKQVGEEIYDNTAQVNNVSTNGIDYFLTYFEGYPFSFEIQNITGTTVEIKNNNSAMTSTAFTATTTGSHRVYVSKATSNWTTSSWLPLLALHNQLEIREDGAFKTNIRLKKVPSQCGVYLKWFNNDGGYSYHLFEEFHKTRLTARSVGEVATNTFLNVGEGLKAPYRNLGKTASERMSIKCNATSDELNVIESLFTSPSVQMYSEQTPYKLGEWVNVEVIGSHSYANKSNINKVSVDIELPEPMTIRL